MIPARTQQASLPYTRAATATGTDPGPNTTSSNVFPPFTIIVG
nr:MAG TPA: hypothetical protein [Bacteriophage sp.]